MSTTATSSHSAPALKQSSESSSLSLAQYGITVNDVRRNLSPASLYIESIREDPDCDIADTGALIAFSGEKTGRSPKDKRVVEHPDSKADIWWGAVNVPFDEETFDTNRERAIDYTAKVAGTEMGVTEPQATFSPCFGGPFLMWRPATKYAELLAEKMQKHKANAWLVNTGWSGGAYGVGARMKLKLTRASPFRPCVIPSSESRCPQVAQKCQRRSSCPATLGATSKAMIRRPRSWLRCSATISTNFPRASLRKCLLLVHSVLIYRKGAARVSLLIPSKT